MTIDDKELEDIGYIPDPQEIKVEFKDLKNEAYSKQLDNEWNKEFGETEQAQKVTDEDIEFVIDTMVKEAKHDRISIEQLWYGMGTTFTLLPMPHKVNSKEAGAGKSYLLNKVASVFPDERVIILAGASDKAILHRHGKMVIKNEETGALEDVEPIIDNLEEELETLESVEKKQQDKTKIKEVRKEIKRLQQNQKKLIDLTNTIIVIQDSPSESLLINVISLLSQDSDKDQEYDFNDKTGSGQIIHRSNILRGMPVLFTTRVIDDTRNSRFEEINRRAVNVAPNVSKEKIDSAVDLIFKRNFLPPEIYDKQVVSRGDREKARKITSRIVDKLIKHTRGLEGRESGIIPLFGDSITHCIPTAEEDNWAMTSSERLARYLAIITKVRMDSRPRFVNMETGVHWIIPIFKDLKKSLELMKVGGSNVRSYIVEFYNRVFKYTYGLLSGPDYLIKTKYNNKGESYEVKITEDREGLTTIVLAEKTNEILGIPKPSTDELYKQYLQPLMNQGIIDKITSKIDGRANIYFPSDENRNISSLFANSDDLRLEARDHAFYPTQEAMIQFADLVLNTENTEKNTTPDTPIENNKIYRLLDPDGNEITPKELVERYLTDPDTCFKEVRDSNAEDEN